MLQLFNKYFRCVSIGLLFLAALIVLNGCEEPIDVDISDIEPTIVIDGAITDNPGGSRVLLNLTANISGATVIVDDNDGNSESLIEAAPGKYVFTSLHGQPGKTYNIKVEYNGKKYTGSSTLNQSMQIDSIRFEQVYSYSLWFFPVASYRTILYLKNKPGIDEYCMIKISDGINTSRIVYQDKYADDKPTVLQDNYNLFDKNETVTVELLTIDKAAYEYFFRLNEMSDESGLDIPDILNTNTYNPKSNLSNGALGYFYAYSYKKYTVTVK